MNDLFYQMKNKTLFICVITGLAILSAGPVFAQSSADARLRRLENEIQTLSRAVFRGEMPSAGGLPGRSRESIDSSAQAGIEVRLSQIEMDMRALTGRVEELMFRLNRLQSQVDQSIADLEMRISAVEQNKSNAFGGPSENDAPGRFIPEHPPETDVPPAVNEPLPPSTGNKGSLGTLSYNNDITGQRPYSPPQDKTNDPAAAYETAFSLVRKQRFEEAENAFRDFLKKYPDHSLVPNAMYWLAETYYVRGNYEAAARMFAEAYQKYPEGPKAPDNMLKMGLSLSGMGRTKDACVAFTQLQREFKNGADPILNRAQQEMEDLGCEGLVY